MKGNDKFVWDIYQQSPPMSTYTLAMAVVPKKYDVMKIKDGKRVLGVWTRTYDEEQRNRILNETMSFLSFFENYFGVKEMLPKIDYIQSMLTANAMENWGLVIYNVAGKLEDSGIVAHELAHFWFGNLVTCKDWNQ